MKTPGRSGSMSLFSVLIAFTAASPGLGSDIVVSGTVRHEAVLQTNSTEGIPYEVTTTRYIVEATPAQIGVPVALDHDLVLALCADKDGCYMVLAMVNWNEAGQPDNVASRTNHLFIADNGEISRWWRLANDVTGLDLNNMVEEWSIYDCYFTDAELPGGGGPNSRIDFTAGFALLNIQGGSYSDITTTCRLILID